MTEELKPPYVWMLLASDPCMIAREFISFWKEHPEVEQDMVEGGPVGPYSENHGIALYLIVKLTMEDRFTGKDKEILMSWRWAAKVHKTALRYRVCFLQQEVFKDTAGSSDMTLSYEHPSYKKIIALGEDVLPIIIERLKPENVDFWQWALYQITGELSVDITSETPVDELCAAWKTWWEIRTELQSY